METGDSLISSYCSRDEKRHQEKKNKSERASRKKEDITRVRQLVDRALSLDPRIAKFKREEKAAKEAKRKGGPVVDSKKKEEDEAAAKVVAAQLAAEAELKNAEDKVRVVASSMS